MERAMLPAKAPRLAIISSLVLTFFMFSACGGGSTKTPAPPLTAQEIQFTQTGTIELFVGDNFTNKATGQGIGVVSYTSSDTQVANVDNAGVVSVKSAGIATITATIAGDNQYLSASKTYNLQVTPTSITASAWVGQKDTIFNFPKAAAGMSFYRSSADNCDYTNYTTCPDGQLDLLAETKIIDTSTRLNQAGYYLLKYKQKAGSFEPYDFAQSPLVLRAGYQIIEFKNKFWLIAGRVNNTDKNDIWSSSDGINWVLEKEHAEFSARSYHQSIVFNGKLWIMGGLYDNPPEKADEAWSSDNGINWTKETNIPTRINGQKLATLQNQLWVIGDTETRMAPQSCIPSCHGDPFRLETVSSNNGWSTSTGNVWEHHTNILFPNSYATQIGFGALVTFNNQLMITRVNSDPDSYTLDNMQPGVRHFSTSIWASTDGLKWAEIATSSLLPQRNLQVVTANNLLWLYGYNKYTDQYELWYSHDGISWEYRFSNMPRTEGNIRSLNSLLIWNQESSSQIMDITPWATSDGTEWRKAMTGAFNLK